MITVAEAKLKSFGYLSTKVKVVGHEVFAFRSKWGGFCLLILLFMKRILIFDIIVYLFLSDI